MSDHRLVIAVPVKDEAERLGACLRALASQQAAEIPTILVLINNSSDDSAAIARRFAAKSRCRVLVEEVVLRANDANAGGARRIAMHKAAELAGTEGILFTTDADGRVAPNWLAANLAAIAAGADAVAGRAIIDPVEEALIPLALREADARECRYAALLDEIAAAVDPDPADPWPRHDEHSGASIAVTAEVFRVAGGIPVLAIGEDRAFFRSLRRIDARIRHDKDVQVIVSGRTEGRAKGGMADTIRRRLVCPDMFLDDRLESVQDFVLRCRLRRQAHLLWAARTAEFWPSSALARDLVLPSGFLRETLTEPFFGAAWDALENASPILRRRPVPVASVMHEIAVATAILAEAQAPVANTRDARDDQAIGLSA